MPFFRVFGSPRVTGYFFLESTHKKTYRIGVDETKGVSLIYLLIFECVSIENTVFKTNKDNGLTFAQTNKSHVFWGGVLR